MTSIDPKIICVPILIFLAGCSGGSVGDTAGEQETTSTSAGGSRSGGGGSKVSSTGSGGTTGTMGTAGTTSGTAPTGLPCDVRDMLMGNCTGCHTDPPQDGVPVGLGSYDDLVAPSVSDPTRKVADVALTRIQAQVRPMPPSPNPRVAADQIAALSNWVMAGYPKGTCGSVDGSVEGGGNPYNTPLVCTSMKMFTGDEHTYPKGAAREQMFPGRACLECHAAGMLKADAPALAFGGTAYPTAHEPDNCNSTNIPAGATVQIVDAKMKMFQATIDPVGNFSIRANATAPITFPIDVKIVAGNKERIMGEPAPNGDCNGCHTVNGTSVDGGHMPPGRIMLP
jgi:mono/diheme cytochrome c family protein